MKNLSPIEDIATILAYAELAVGFARRGEVQDAEVLMLAIRQSLETRYDATKLNSLVVQRLEEIKVRSCSYGSIPLPRHGKQN